MQTIKHTSPTLLALIFSATMMGLSGCQAKTETPHQDAHTDEKATHEDHKHEHSEDKHNDHDNEAHKEKHDHHDEHNHESEHSEGKHEHGEGHGEEHEKGHDHHHHHHEHMAYEKYSCQSNNNNIKSLKVRYDDATDTKAAMAYLLIDGIEYDLKQDELSSPPSKSYTTNIGIEDNQGMTWLVDPDDGFVMTFKLDEEGNKSTQLSSSHCSKVAKEG